ncbi:helix-turn-helix transcriptional regulator [Oceanidesulfovibrio marinus]|uniref:Peptidase S24 n=1 Tax=Oceanidesulfovibrio marinus TaxID=370038 RepID=A0A6P1ZMP2_9BACT|nr:S24 family peptidase [Oceanidesulfovibrio marinus]TVM35637.1 peptidase S24 [Oceanidesulfovibrio marinus]
MGLHEDILKKLSDLVEIEGGQAAIHRATGVGQSTLSNIKHGKHSPKFEKIATLLEHFGAQIVFPGDAQPETVKSICFVSPKITGVDPYVHMAHDARATPDEDNYLAIPVVNRVGAGGGYMEEKEVRDWMIAYRPALPQPVSSNLVAVTVAKDQYSMVPLIFPGDILLVDRNDYEPKPPGSIMLVIEPEPDRGERIKRVATKRRDGDMEITFYSQDAERYPPDTYYLNRDYGGDIRNAIGGRVLWGWTDITRR